MKTLLDQTQYRQSTRDKITQLLELITPFLNKEGQIVYEGSDVGSYIADLISSIFQKEKTKKLIDENKFVDFCINKFGLSVSFFKY